MKTRTIISVLVLALGIVHPVLKGEAGIDSGPLFDYPPIKATSSFTFLKIGTSPRAMAMGEAFTSMAGGIDAIFYNPGGLGFIQGGQYTLSYTDWLVNSRIYTGAIAYRMGGNVWGVSVVSVKPEDVEETTILKPLGTGKTITASDIAVGLVFARQMTDKVSWGVHARYVREDLFLTTASNWEFDLGMTAYTGYKSIRIAAAAKNVGGEVTVETRPFSPPVYFNFGVSGELIGEKEDASYLTISAETLFATDYGQRWHFGGELWMGNILALRGGYRVNYDVENYSVGAGLKYAFGDRDIRVDVAYSSGGDYFNAPLRVSLGGSF